MYSHESDVPRYERPDTPAAGDVSCGKTTDPNLIHKARQLVARVYAERGFIQPENISDDGVIGERHDPDQHNADYYVVIDHEDDVIATARTIRHEDARALDSFPLVRDHIEALDPAIVDDIENRYGWENVREISGLARDRAADPKKLAATQLYKAMFLDAWKENDGNEQVFVMACNPNLRTTLEQLFGDSIQQMGPPLDYPGQPAEPVMFTTRAGAIETINRSKDKKNPYRKLHQQVVEFFLHGPEANTLDPHIVDALRANGYDAIVSSIEKKEWGTLNNDRELKRMRRLGAYGILADKAQKYKPELIAGALLTGYTVARTAAVAVGVSPSTDVDWRIFLGIELATTAPYVWAAGDIIRNTDTPPEDRSRARSMGAYATYYGSLLAPYGYIVAAGGATTPAALATTAGMAALPLVAKYAKQPVTRIIQRVRRRGVLPDDGLGVDN